MPRFSGEPVKSPRFKGERVAEGNANDRANAFLGGVIEGVPIVGPYLKGGLDRAGAAVRSLVNDTPYDSELEFVQRRVAENSEEYPGTNLTGQVAGSIAALGGVGATAVGARALGLSQPTLAGRVGMSALSSGAISGADTAARGGDLGDIGRSAALGTAIGTAVPVAGHLAQKGYRAVTDRVGGAVRGAVNPEKQAGIRVGRAIGSDRATGANRVLGAADEATAREFDQPLMNIDRGGETTRALARAASNTNPEARAIISNAADDRFASQGSRAGNMIRRIMGDKVDDLGLQERLAEAARAVNRPAYKAAERAPAAQAMWDDQLQQLMQSADVQRAAQAATRRSTNRVALEGGEVVKNPFTFQNGRAQLIQNADGSVAYPNLRFWDQVQRNLRASKDLAARSGDKTRAAELDQLRSSLNRHLDRMVPEFGAARAGAAKFFGADDAVEAGRKFIRSKGQIPEFEKRIGSLKPAEKKAFEVGAASELLDSIGSANDRTSVIRMFKSPEMRSKIEMALGPDRAKRVEAFVRVEDAMDRVRGALGNSTTARQLMEMGIVGGGTWAYTGDPLAGGAAALATRAARALGGKVDERVTRRVAEMLMSDDPRIIENAVRQATYSPQYLRVVEALADAAGVAARGAGITAATSE